MRSALVSLVGAACVITGCASDRMSAVARPPAPEVRQVIGRTELGRELRVVQRGHGSRRVYIIGAIHGNEPEGLVAAQCLAALPESHLDSLTIRVLEDANPDGTAAGTRGNSRRRDLNRNWPASNFGSPAAHGNAPLSEPETQALHRDIERFNPQVIIVFHSIASGPFVNFDGPGEHLASAFAEAAREIDPRWKVVAQMGYRTPGSMGSYFGIDRGVPILTIEFKRGQDPETAAAAALAGTMAIARSRPTRPE